MSRSRRYAVGIPSETLMCPAVLILVVKAVDGVSDSLNCKQLRSTGKHSEA